MVWMSGEGRIYVPTAVGSKQLEAMVISGDGIEVCACITLELEDTENACESRSVLCSSRAQLSCKSDSEVEGNRNILGFQRRTTGSVISHSHKHHDFWERYPG